MKTIEQLTNNVTDTLDRTARAMAQHAVDTENSAMFAILRVEEISRDAARNEVCSHVLRRIRKGATVQEILDEAVETVMRGARDLMCQSTNPGRNIFDRTKVVAWAEIYTAIVEG